MEAHLQVNSFRPSTGDGDLVARDTQPVSVPRASGTEQ